MRACFQLGVMAHPDTVRWRDRMQHDHHNITEDRRLLQLRRGIVRLDDGDASALHILPVDPASKWYKWSEWYNGDFERRL